MKAEAADLNVLLGESAKAEALALQQAPTIRRKTSLPENAAVILVRRDCAAVGDGDFSAALSWLAKGCWCPSLTETLLTWCSTLQEVTSQAKLLAG